MPVMTNDYLIEELLKDPRYQIHPNGVVLTNATGTKGSRKDQWRECAFREQTGYKYLYYKYKQLALHRILYAKFIGVLDENLVVNHKDLNRSNNNLDNLELITQSANTKHAYQTHSIVVRKNLKLDYEKAEEIRSLFKIGKSHKELMEKYDISKGSVSAVLKNKTWTKPLSVAKHLHPRTNCNSSKSQPKWVDLEIISNMYKNTPTGFVVDHIIPLNNPNVCGLHVPWNLNYLSKRDNEIKGNAFDFTVDNNSWKK